MKKKFTISVTDFAIPSPLNGSIDTYSGFYEGNLIGIELHKEIQIKRKKDFPNYQAEIPITHDFKINDYIFTLRGRIDGAYEANSYYIDEIKSAFSLSKLKQNIFYQIESHPYCLQLKTYGYIHWLRHKEIPKLNLILVSSRNKETYNLALDLNITEYEIWLKNRLQSLVNELKKTTRRIKNRKKIGKALMFPFAQPRVGQKELIATLQHDLKQTAQILIQAPTGLGKTLGVLYPVLKESMQRGQKTIYVTPKNSQHHNALEAVKLLQKNHKISCMAIKAKTKICLKQQPICNSEYCEFAKDYYQKITDFQIIKKLNVNKNITDKQILKIAKKYQVCPYQLQMDNITNADVIICDYNYVFSPHALKNKLSTIFLGESEKPNLIIDEIHNLPERSRQYFCASISVSDIQRWSMAIEKIPISFKNKFQLILSEAINIIEICHNSQAILPEKIQPPISYFQQFKLKLETFRFEYLESDVEIGQDDSILSFCQYWLEFSSILEAIDFTSKNFFVSYHPQQRSIKITCCDASSLIKNTYSPYKSIVGFSATVKPFLFYSQLSGLNLQSLKTYEFSSPFKKENRKLLIIPQLSSKFSLREYNYPRIALAIQKITSVRKGNYLIFFPSFNFLENVYSSFASLNDFKIIRQTKQMCADKVNSLLMQLKSLKKSHLIFAVQGGVLAEGIDYLGEMAIGCIIVGVPLPNFDWERKQLSQYYEENYHSGFDYAYINLSMSKAIQAAGRVIRCENDKGIIVLMDDRFLITNYSNCMPKDWFEESPKELISNSIISDITRFWLKE